MKNYKHFTSSDRDIISIELAKGTSKQKIADILNVHVSSIYREIKRNSVTQRNSHFEYYNTYLSSSAHNLYFQRRKNNSNSSKFTEDVKHIIEIGLKQDLSFSTICDIRHKTDKSFPSARTLYNYFKRSWIKTPKNYRLKLNKRKVATRVQSKLKEVNTKHISQRPRYVTNHKHFGHWELDLIESAGGGGYIISFIECMTEFAITQYIDTKEAGIINKFLKKVMKQYPVYSITTDNGTEFNNLYKLKTATNHLEIYYTDPASPWQKGLVEYFNKLMREYIPKNSIFTKTSARKIAYYTDKINNRPWKILNYNTPNQVQKEMMSA